MNWSKLIFGTLVLLVVFYFCVSVITYEINWIPEMKEWKSMERVLLVTSFTALWIWTVLIPSDA